MTHPVYQVFKTYLIAEFCTVTIGNAEIKILSIMKRANNFG